MPMRVALLSLLSQVRFRIKQISKKGSCFFPSALASLVCPQITYSPVLQIKSN